MTRRSRGQSRITVRLNDGQVTRFNAARWAELLNINGAVFESATDTPDHGNAAN